MDLESKIVVILGLESSGKSAVANGLHQENGGFPEYAPGAEKEPQGDSDHIRTKKFSSDLCIEIHD
jgi:nicotinamide riboside kinase